jgi:hypothetical protein
MKKRSSTIIDRIKIGYPFGFKMFGILSTAGAIVIGICSAIGYHYPLQAIYYIVALSIIYSLFYVYRIGIGTHMPDIFSDDESVDGDCVAEFCSPEKLDKACEMTKVHYKNEYVPGVVAEQWRLTNPKAFVDITNCQGELVSTFGIIVPNKDFMDIFIKGKIADTKLGGEDVLNFRESKKSNRLYISGVVVKNAGTYIGHKRARIMVWVMLQYYKRYYGFTINRELFAVAVNPDSNAMLKNCGFKIVMDSKREDKGTLYKIMLSHDSWQKLLERIGDFSKICSIQFK